MKDIVNMINEILQNKHWSIYELSNQADISSNTIYNWINRKSVPKMKNIIKICDAADISLEHFFCSTESLNQKISQEERLLLDKIAMLNKTEKELLLKLMMIFNNNLSN